MKFILLFCCTFAVVYTETQEEFITYVKTSFRKAADICDKTVKPSKECRFFCMVQELKVMKADGTVDTENLLKVTDRIKKFSPEMSAKVQGAFDTCITNVKHKEDSCSYSLDLVECYSIEKISRGIPDAFS